MRSPGPIGDVVRGQACLFGGLTACIGIRPQGLGANGGMSYYGSHPQTVLPYAVALIGSALFIRRALHAVASFLPSPDGLRRTANRLTALAAGIVATPVNVLRLIDRVHVMLGAALFMLQLLLVFQILRWTHGDRITVCLLVVQLAGGLIAAIYLLPKHGFLLHGQMVFQLAFGAILMRSCRLLLPSAGRRDFHRASTVDIAPLK